jgi:hypothetical protein
MLNENDFNKLVNLLSIGKGLLGIGNKSLIEMTKWLDDIKKFLNDFNEFFKLENTTIDDMLYILQNQKQFILEKIVNKGASSVN